MLSILPLQLFSSYYISYKLYRHLDIHPRKMDTNKFHQQEIKEHNKTKLNYLPSSLLHLEYPFHNTYRKLVTQKKQGLLKFIRRDLLSFLDNFETFKSGCQLIENVLFDVEPLFQKELCFD